jgi:hypothetical protein
MLPFVFSVTQAYALEFGDLYMRVFKDLGQVLSGGLPYEIAMPYAEADLPDSTTRSRPTRCSSFTRRSRR